ncbi:TPA: autotransporter outer membrane beta-barrel domain-containing protein [Yersinia enterocolitica]|nr:autotransporter outer membrane beta-barrel domain-containing protein [Yersinia enterocolitica]
MNKVYNTVWNESTGMWVVTSELTRKGGRRPRQIRHTALAGLIAGLLLPSTPTLAAAYDNQTLENTSMSLSAGDTATNTTINNSGAQYIFSGGSATSTTINSDGLQYVSSGGSATSTTINSYGTQEVSSGGSAADTTINDGGVMSIAAGGTGTGIVQNSGGAIKTNTSAALSGSNVNGSFGVAGGSASNMLLESGGYLAVLSGHQATSTTINSGGVQHVSGGSATSTTINRAGVQYVSSGGSATSTTINSSGVQYVSSGGSATSTTINSSGVQHVSGGGSAADTTINDGGVMSIAAGGTGTGIVQNSGGAISTNTSAALSGSNVNGSFGVAGGSASNMLLENGGILVVLTGHQATDTQVGKGGELQVENGAQLLGTTTIKDDGKLSGNTVTNNGHLYFLNNSAATYTGNLTGTGDLKQEGGHLTLSGNLSQDGGITIQSSGAMTMDNLQAMANVITQQGASLSLTNGSTLTGRIAGDNTGSGDVTVKNSVWQLAGDSTVGALAMDKGTINFHPSQTTRLTPAFQPLSLTVGSLSGNGTFLMNTDIASHTGDMLNVTGNATGNFVLDIKNTGQEPVSAGTPLQVVHTGGGDAGFTLNGGKVDAGTWEYYLNKENTDWYLTPDTTQPVNPGTGNPDTGNLECRPTKSTYAVLGMATAPAYVFNSELQSLRFRHGDVTANTRSPGGVWGRYMGTDNRIGGASGYTLTQSGMETGGDKVFELGDNQLAVGAFVSYSDNGVSHNRGGSSTVGSTGGGLYATWFDNDGYYVDGVIKLNRFSNELRTWMSDGTAVKGDYSQNGFGGSLEAGKAFSLNENTWVQPYVRTTAFRGEAKNISLNNGMTARLGATKSIQGEAGVSLGMNLDVAGTTVKPYLTAAVSHEFSDNNKVRINNRYDFTNDISGSTGKYGAGVSAQLTPHAGVWAEANYQKGDNMESPVTGSVGFRINF